jgi:hypothetical protein
MRRNYPQARLVSLDGKELLALERRTAPPEDIIRIGTQAQGGFFMSKGKLRGKWRSTVDEFSSSRLTVAERFGGGVYEFLSPSEVFLTIMVSVLYFRSRSAIRVSDFRTHFEVFESL